MSGETTRGTRNRTGGVREPNRRPGRVTGRASDDRPSTENDPAVNGGRSKPGVRGSEGRRFTFTFGRVFNPSGIERHGMSSQSTLGDDDLFGEAAAEMRADVEEHLAAARAELPAADEVWETEADNVLGVLNGLKTALDVGEAERHLTQAKKWYVMGERADAFEDADDLAEAIESTAELLEQIETARDQVSDLTGTMPQLRGALTEAAEAAEADEDEDEDETDTADEDDEDDE